MTWVWAMSSPSQRREACLRSAARLGHSALLPAPAHAPLTKAQAPLTKPHAPRRTDPRSQELNAADDATLAERVHAAINADEQGACGEKGACWTTPGICVLPRHVCPASRVPAVEAAAPKTVAAASPVARRYACTLADGHAPSPLQGAAYTQPVSRLCCQCVILGPTTQKLRYTEGLEAMEAEPSNPDAGAVAAALTGALNSNEVSSSGGGGAVNVGVTSADLARILR